MNLIALLITGVTFLVLAALVWLVSKPLSEEIFVERRKQN